MKKNLSLELIKEEKKKSRIQKISELIKRAIAEIFLTISFNDQNRKNIFIFVSHVELSGDGKSAVIFVGSLSGNSSHCKDEVLQSIDKNLTRIKKEFSKKIELRYTPRLKFRSVSEKSINP